MRDIVMIGSKAMQARGLIPNRKAKDLDLVTSFDSTMDIVRELREAERLISAYPFMDGEKYLIRVRGLNSTIGIIEVEIAWPGSTGAELIEIVQKRAGTQEYGDTMLVPDLDVLYAIKMSHRYLKDSPHFRKTMEDIWTLRDVLGRREIDPELMEWFKRREKETYSYGHPNLNQSSNGFFSGDGVQYVWDHDSIHRAVAIGPEPAYKSFQDGEVRVSKEKWDQLGLLTKLNSVVEESYVLALERHQIPNDFKPDPEKSFLIALEKVCTSITSGWWREFAWENYYAAKDLNRRLGVHTYVDKFHNGIRSGLVVPGKDHHEHA